MENIKLETTGQKHISTLATDIKKLIADISNGKPANMTEENMNVFGENTTLYSFQYISILTCIEKPTENLTKSI